MRFLFALLAALACAPAWAALPDEIQVYTDDLEAPGERGIELHVNASPRGRDAPAYPGEVVTHNGLRVTPEISWGLAPNWDWGLYLPFVHAAGGSNDFAGPKVRLKWVPLRPAEGSTGAFAGINWELAVVQRKFEEAGRSLEIRPIVGWHGEKWLLAFNPIIESNLAGPDKGVLTFAPAFKVARDVGNRTALGVELYSDLGRLSHLAPGGEQSHTLYFVVDTERFSFGVGKGIHGPADPWTVKAIISF